MTEPKTTGFADPPNGEQWQCAGSAIYRTNVCKVPKNPEVLRLPKNEALVFGFGEFEAHHRRATMTETFEKDIRCQFCFVDRFHTKTIHDKSLEAAEKEEKKISEELSKQIKQCVVSKQ